MLLIRVWLSALTVMHQGLGNHRLLVSEGLGAVLMAMWIVVSHLPSVVVEGLDVLLQALESDGADLGR